MTAAETVYFNYLKENNIRRSKQRENILKIFLKTEKHLTISELHQLAKLKDPDIGVATVYRAMIRFHGNNNTDVDAATTREY